MESRTILIINTVVLILITLIMFHIITTYFMAEKKVIECEDSGIKLKYEACFDYFSNITFMVVTRGNDRSKLELINASFLEGKKFSIEEIPEKNQSKRYRFSSTKNPKKIIVELQFASGETNICGKEDMINVDYCSSLQSMNANFSIDETKKEVSNTIQINGISDILSKELVEQTEVWDPACKSDWACENWEACKDGVQKRNCKDKNLCLIPTNPLDFARTCNSSCIENWQCEWSGCESGYTIPNCRDKNNCGTSYLKPDKLPCFKRTTSDCAPKLACREWGECRVNYNLEALETGISELQGVKSRTCSDTTGCVLNYIEREQCTLKADIYTKEEEWCGKTYLSIYDKLSNKLLSRLDYSRSNSYLNINLAMSNEPGNESCTHCSNLIKDEDEERVDCGGSCKPC